MSHPSTAPLWALLWSCPRCLRRFAAYTHVPHEEREEHRAALSARVALHCTRCGAHRQPWECGIEWQPENEAARTLNQRP